MQSYNIRSLTSAYSDPVTLKILIFNNGPPDLRRTFTQFEQGIVKAILFAAGEQFSRRRQPGHVERLVEMKYGVQVPRGRGNLVEVKSRQSAMLADRPQGRQVPEQADVLHQEFCLLDRRPFEDEAIDD